MPTSIGTLFTSIRAWHLETIDQFRANELTTTNVLRRRHQNTPDLVLDASLNNDAQQYAEYLADTGFTLVHSGSPEGENLYYRKHQGIIDCDAHFEPYASFMDVTQFV